MIIVCLEYYSSISSVCDNELPYINISEIAKKASISSGGKNVEKRQTEDDFWNSESTNSSTKARSITKKINETKEIDQGGWGDWNENSTDGKIDSTDKHIIVFILATLRN